MSESFLDLLTVHAELIELFCEHQDALVDRDFARALERLLELRRRIDEHMHAEEELFARVFARMNEIGGTPIELFLGEHKHLRELLAQFETATRRIDPAAADVRRRVTALLDDETLFKAFFSHHDERERNLLYPTLDRTASAADRQKALRRNGRK